MAIAYDLRKTPLETQAMLMLSRVPPFLRAGVLNDMIDGQGPEVMMPLCIAAHRLGHVDFAREHTPKIESPELIDALCSQARAVCRTSAPLDLAFVMTTTPIRYDMELYPRDGSVVELCFTDGASAFCKSRASGQEAFGYDVLKLLGYPSLRYAIQDEWIVMPAVPGRTLGDCVLFPELSPITDGIDPVAVYRGLLGYVAFDYVFGMVDRNENGVVLTSSHKPDAGLALIDHEYLLIHPGPALTGREFLHYRLYLRELGFPQELVCPDVCFHDNLQDTEDMFRRLADNEPEILDILNRHIQSSGRLIDGGPFMIRSGPETVSNVAELIHEGVEGFAENLTLGMNFVRASNMFQMP